MRVARKLRAELSFDYEGRVVSADEPTRGSTMQPLAALVRRDSAVEKAAAGCLAN